MDSTHGFERDQSSVGAVLDIYRGNNPVFANKDIGP